MLSIDQYAGTNLIESAFGQVQLDSMAYSASDDPSWPTLEWLIHQNKRLIVFSNNAENALYGLATKSWLLPTYKYAWSTSTSIMNEDDFTCEVEQGSQGTGKLGILNHVISTPVGVMATARKINIKSSIQRHLQKCSAKVNFISVAFSNFGDLARYVNDLNHEGG